MINPEYIRFGEEWKAEMRKLPKDVIINICCQLGIEKQKEIDKHKEQPNVISDWLEKNGNPKIAKQVEEEALELFKQNTIEEVFEWLTTKNYLTDLKETLIKDFNQFKKE